MPGRSVPAQPKAPCESGDIVDSPAAEARCSLVSEGARCSSQPFFHGCFSIALRSGIARTP
eukprot:1268123-Pyramimonas_sp.AAC.1